MPRNPSSASSLAIALAALPGLAFSQGAGAAQSSDGAGGNWQFELTPYLWASAMKGDVQAGNLPKIGVDISFGDILDVLDFGIMGAFEARKGRWGFLADAIYMKVSDSADARRTGPGPVGATLTASADATLKQTMLAVAVAYRAIEGTSPLDVVGGLRYSKIDVDAAIDGSLFAATRTVSRKGDKDWVDPYIGVRIQHPLAPRWTMVGYADVGGFGVGSDFTWQAALGVRYDFSKTVSASFGYRQLDVDYDKSGFLYDMSNRGVYLGASIRF